MLIIREVDSVALFSADSNSIVPWNFHDGALRRTLNNFKGENSLRKMSLKLVRTHFDNHFLNYFLYTSVICIFS